MKRFAAVLVFIFALTAQGSLCDSDYLPPDHGLVNVKTDPHCGLAGDGTTDDTAALQACVTWYADHDRAGAVNIQSRDTLFFPCGAYRLSAPVRWVGADAGERAYTSLRGEPGCVVLRVPDNSPAFSNPVTPQPLLWLGNPGAQGSAFHSNLWDLAIEVGEGNPGLIAVDGVWNNMVSVRDFTIVAPPSSCAVGVLINRKFPGPALFKNVTVDGCDAGIRIAYPYTSLTFSGLTLRRQRSIGLDIDRHTVSVEGLVSDQPLGAPAVRVRNTSSGAGPMLALVGAQLMGTGPVAIHLPPEVAGGPSRQAQAILRDVEVTGYTYALDRAGQLTSALPAEYLTHPEVSASPSQPGTLRLPLIPHPHYTHPNPGDWVRVASPGSAADAAPLIEAAAQTAKVVYLTGNYWLGSPIDLCGAVERVVGFDHNFSQLAGSTVSPIFRTCPGMDHAVELESLFANRNAGAFPEPRLVHQGPGDLVLTNVLNLTRYVSTPGAGDVFVENTCCGGFLLSPGQNLTARQFNVESVDAPDLRVDGGDAVVIGFKTENNLTPFAVAQNGARLEVLNAFHYCSTTNLLPGPIVRSIDSQVAYSYSSQSGCRWNPQLEAIRSGSTTIVPHDHPSLRSRQGMVLLLKEEP